MIEMHFEDNLTPKLRKLFELSDGLGMQAVSKGASKVRDRMVDQSKSLGSTDWGQRFTRDGRRLLSMNSKKRLYDRVSHKQGGQRQASLGELIRYKQYPLSRTVLVGFLNTKGYNTIFYKGGIEEKGNYVKGTQSKSIAERMAKGGRIALTKKQRGFFRASGFPGIAKRGYVVRKPHRFMKPMQYLGIINSEAIKEFDVAMHQFIKTA